MNKKNMVLAFIALIVTTLVGCSSSPKAQFFFNPETKMSADTPITIQIQEDVSGVRGELQVLLQQSGYKVHSPIAGKKTTTLDKDSQYTEINSLKEKQTYTQQEFQKFGTTNMLTISGVGKTDDDGNFSYESLFAEVASSETGTILMSMNFPKGKYDTSKLLQEIVHRMNLCVKENKCDEKSQQGESKSNAGLGAAIVGAMVVVVIAIAAN